VAPFFAFSTTNPTGLLGNIVILRASWRSCDERLWPLASPRALFDECAASELLFCQHTLLTD
jgi:hypothetical protein